MIRPIASVISADVRGTTVHLEVRLSCGHTEQIRVTTGGPLADAECTECTARESLARLEQLEAEVERRAAHTGRYADAAELAAVREAQLELRRKHGLGPDLRELRASAVDVPALAAVLSRQMNRETDRASAAARAREVAARIQTLTRGGQ